MKRYVAVLAALCSAAATGAGCNLIVDSSGYAVRGAGVDGSTGDTGAGDTGVGDTGVEASPKDGGTETSTGDAGPPRDGAAAVCGQGLASGADFTQMVESCVLAVSCDPYFFDQTLAFCLTYDGLHRAAAYTCLAGIHSCADYFTCSHVRQATIADCPNTGASAACNGSLAINCDDQGLGAVRDCASLGGPCSTYEGSDGTVADCVVAPDCTDPDTDQHCTADNQLYSCINGTGFGENCGTDETCTTVDGNTGCYFSQPSCAVSESYACNGAALTFCSDALQQFVDHCGLSGSTCELTDAGIGYCVSPGCTIPTVANCTESCAADGTTLETCIGGAQYAVDCTKYGFTACGQATDTDTSTSPPTTTTFTFCE
jgi:hypothetical protein